MPSGELGFFVIINLTKINYLFSCYETVLFCQHIFLIFFTLLLLFFVFVSDWDGKDVEKWVGLVRIDMVMLG